jgi:hypothetical protein
MKTFIHILILAFIFLLSFGCNKPLVTSPVVSSSDREFIELPVPSGLAIENTFSVSKQIDGSKGGEIILDKNYKGGIHGEVKVIAKILFLPNSFSGNKLVTMSVDAIDGTVTYSPSLNFSKSAELYVKLEGLDLRDVNFSKIDFNYYSSDGNFYPVNYKEIIKDRSSGILELKEGKIPHFSRYGFTKRKID